MVGINNRRGTRRGIWDSLQLESAPQSIFMVWNARIISMLAEVEPINIPNKYGTARITKIPWTRGRLGIPSVALSLSHRRADDH